MAVWRQLIDKMFGRAAQAPAQDVAPMPPVIAPIDLVLPPAIVVPLVSATVEHPTDVGASPEAVALQAAILEEPHDEGSQLVLADLLVAAEDPRGELIVLHHRETTVGLDDPAALERYLLLGALYSFPRARPEEPLLPFTARPGPIARYHLHHADHDYDLRYRRRRLDVRVDNEIHLQRRLSLSARDTWTSTEAMLLLRHLSDAIRAGVGLHLIQLPFTKNALPVYGGGPVRSFGVPIAFTKPRGLAPNELGLAARDYHHWIAVWRRLAGMLGTEPFADR